MAGKENVKPSSEESKTYDPLLYNSMKIYQRNCNTCGNEYRGYGKFYCSSKCQPRDTLPRNPRKKEAHGSWKGKDASYAAKHAHIRLVYGKAAQCDLVGCERKSKRFEWALKRGHEYSHNREDYMQLCKPCHVRYDGIRSGDKHNGWKGGKPDCTSCGKKLTNYGGKLCLPCSRRLKPYWLGKSRKEANAKRISLNPKGV
jgi:hypothetical protein